ncbi:hypothetical protein SAG0315_08280 [Streptococcus agalactiae GB00202]|nr:hypothetical protein SAG0315_08280 [Streptococcus agalactiae GB00202]
MINSSNKPLFGDTKLLTYPAVISDIGAQIVVILGLTAEGSPILYALMNRNGNNTKVAIKPYQKTIFPIVNCPLIGAVRLATPIPT